jgi:phospholipid-binding lipoprotein MlaA
MTAFRALWLALVLACGGWQVGPACADPPDSLYRDLGDDLDDQGDGLADPYEAVNRATLKLNQAVDRWLLGPLNSVYRFAVPEAGRRSIRNALLNLNTPAVLVNDLLQLELHDAAVTTSRFMVNSTMGLGGLFDVGASFGMPRHRSDFGQTLARYGVASGPYLVLPILGPSTVRDTTGGLVDFLLRPTSYILIGAESVVTLTTIQTGGEGLAEWDAHSDALRLLDESSLDFYAALRSAYFQSRQADIDGRSVQPISGFQKLAWSGSGRAGG